MLQRALTAHQAGRLAEAEQGYRTVLARHATNADAAYLLGLAVQQQGRAAEALVLLQRAVALADQRADFFNSLGEAHRALGQLPDAMAAFRAAIARRPAYVDAQLNLATTFQLAGRLEEALITLFEAVAAFPHEGALRARLALLLQGVSLGSGNPLVRSVLLTLCHDPAISAQSLSGAMLGLVKGTPAYAALQAAVKRDADLLAVNRDALYALAHDDLLLAALPRVVVTDPEVELVLTRVRKALLLAPADEASALTAFIGAIAMQAYNTEYGWAIDADEQLALEQLRAEVDAASATPPMPASCESAMLRGAMYATVRQFAAWSTLDDGASPSWSPGLHALVRDALLGQNGDPRPKSAAPDENISLGHPLRVLLVEDNPVNQRVATLMLKKLGYIPDVAGNGREAITAIERHRYDLVFMDLQMPEMDGLQATAEICARWAKGVRPAIVAMTANASTDDRESCLKAGMDNFVSKPVRLHDLRAVLLAVAPLPVAEAASAT